MGLIVEFLNNLISIESITDLFLVKFGLIVSLLVFLPFLSVLLGSLIFALSHVLKTKIFKNHIYLEFAKYQIEFIGERIIVSFLFGVIPFLGFIIFYSQLYGSTIKNSSENLILAFILFIAGLFLTFMYKNGFSNIHITESKNSSNSGNDENSIYPNNISGVLAILFFAISSIITISYLVAAGQPTSLVPETLFNTIFNISSWLYIFLYFSISFSITAAIILSRMNRAGKRYSFKGYVREYATKTGILFTFIQPILFVLIVLSVNISVITFSFFATSMIVLLFMLLVTVQFYLNFRGNNLKSTSIVFIFLLLFTFIIFNAQILSESSHKKESIKSGIYLELFS